MAITGKINIRGIVFQVALAGAMAIGSQAMAQGRVAEPTGKAAISDQHSAEVAASRGDWRAAGRLSGKAYRESPTIINEFNLASYYAHSAQYALAVPLYEDVAAHGQFTHGQAVYDYRNEPRTAREGFTYTDEANRRLAQLTGEPLAQASNR